LDLLARLYRDVRSTKHKIQLEVLEIKVRAVTYRGRSAVNVICQILAA